MGFFDKAVKVIAPAYALRREVARRRLNRLKNLESSGRSFEAVAGGRLRNDFLSTKASADAALSGADGVRNNVRQLEYNNGFVSGPIRRISRNVVGAGIRFQARVVADDNNNYLPTPKIDEKTADRFNFQMERSIRKWFKESDKRLICNFFEQQLQASMALERDGEVLPVIRNSSRRNRAIPTCIEMLEIDRLQTPMEEMTNPSIRNGIKYDNEGVPELYFILKRHPGESITGQNFKGDDFEEIPAFFPNGTKKVLHLFDPTRPEQSRGYSPVASGLKDYQDLDRYREAEIYARLEDACLTGFIKSKDPDGWQGGYTTDDISGGGNGETRRIHEFAPGQINYLDEGEDIVIHEPKRANNNMDIFVNHLLRGPSNAWDIPPEVLSQNWQGMNYSNARTVLLQFYLSCRIRQWYLINHFCIPIYEVVSRQLIAHGKVQAPGFNTRADDFLRHAWILPGWQWVDPVKEANGKETEVNNTFETLTDVLAGKGKDFDETVETRAKELKKIQDLEIKYGVKFPVAKSSMQDPGSDSGELSDGR